MPIPGNLLTTAMAVMRLAPVTSGTLKFEGVELSTLTDAQMRDFRRNLQIIFQDPYSSLDPRRRAGDIAREPLDRMNIGTRKEREEWVKELFRCVGLRPEQARLFPHQFSGGQRQRIGIARALSSRPKLIVCDEPVSALDVAIQAQILNLLTELQKEFGLTYFFLSHDLGVVNEIADKISVIYAGKIVESTTKTRLFQEPLHPYTKLLLLSIPDAAKRGSRLKAIPGTVPDAEHIPPGCSFHPRCPLAEDICKIENPDLVDHGDNHLAACHFIGKKWIDF